MAQSTCRHWLLKTEPKTFSIHDLEKAPHHTTPWDGVRNYQARNFLRDAMAVDDKVLIYHSQAKPLAIVGEAKVSSRPFADPSQFDPQSPYFDPTSTPTNPRWYCVNITHVATFPAPVTRAALAQHPALTDLMLLQRGSRLSVQPVGAAAWGLILAMARG